MKKLSAFRDVSH